MAPGILQDPGFSPVESQPAKKRRLTVPVHVEQDDEEVATAVPSHPLGVKPAGNAYTATVNLKSRCGSFARLPDELLNHILESFDADALIRLGSTCRALYAFTRLDELWRALFVGSSPENFTWRGTWRATYLNTPAEKVTNIRCENLFSDVLYRPFQCAHTSLNPYVTRIPAANAIARLPDLTPEEYSAKWTDKPFILTEPVKAWPVYGKWTSQYLLDNFPDTKFTAEAVDWPMSTYTTYINNNTDESPLYLFDRAFAPKTNIDTSLPPPPPQRRLLDSGMLRPRPLQRPARSGSTFHKDPNATSAWNAVLTGSKYWLMFPSGGAHAPPPGIIVSDDQSEITAPLSIAEYLLTFHELARATPGAKEGICYQGEVLHVPSGWFHLVLNLDESLALTQNFVPRARVADVLGFLRDQREQVSGFKEDVADRAFELFVERLGEEHPDVLAEGMEKLEKRSKQGRGRWEELTKGGEDGEGGGGTFSFGFAGDDSDADIP
ncbi:hypothetical protein C7974DRAFT_391186 [Boeremia exigua]|uniref:uncharacterized protein n=1 Tax=Boeremia exigua TaxID=749465 RepID=UPI001E8DB3AE|nr:uncharacterized protein C7974DRAFT_391186 [Boeremia exigua]KAH6638265.1 hypothetical protein C7974DRAFT_391186 [Boeremia exigua]